VRRTLLFFLLLMLSCSFPVFARTSDASPRKGDVQSNGFEFGGTTYLPRWSQDNQFEFTPAGQEDLKSRKDMVTVVLYPNVHEENGLAAQANAVLTLYSIPTAKVLLTTSVPRTKQKTAEHFIAVMFAQRNAGEQYMEFAATRLLLVSGQGVAIVYSRRFYGAEAPHESGPGSQRMD
jgi:hypothetical protein